MTNIHEVNLRLRNTNKLHFNMELDSEYESDRNIKGEMECGQLYELRITEICTSVLRPGDTFIDIGANVGWFSLLAAAIVGPTGHVIAFEPAPANVEKLRRNVELNNFTNITINEIALGDAIGTAEFYLNPYGNGGHALWDMQAGRPNRKASTPITVQRDTLDNWYSQHDCAPPRAIKIDTEGHDKRVLAGARQLLEKYHPPFIFSELHHSGMRNFGDSQLEFKAMMRNCGYDTFLLGENFPLPIMLPERTEIRSSYTQDLLFATQEDVGKLCPELVLAYPDLEEKT